MEAPGVTIHFQLLKIFHNFALQYIYRSKIPIRMIISMIYGLQLLLFLLSILSYWSYH
jgi:hypothetical protein